jgi:protein-histidine pros-kinase
MKLRGKVNLAITLAFVVGLGLATAGAYKILTEEAIEASARDARILIEEASAIRTYTANSIAPLLQQQMTVQFLPHSIPSFAAQTNFKLVQKKLTEYSYREPTLNPTNINDRAVDWEADIINDFRNHPDKKETMAIRDTPIGSYLTLSRPLKVSAAVCLTCHSTPAAAPATMVALYGSEHGFGWKLGETVGAQVVSIPLAVPFQRAYNSLIVLVAALAGVFLVILLIVDTLLRALVVKPVVNISAMASDVSMGKMDAPEYVHRTNDEIGSLAASFNRMRRSLQNAMKMLDEQQPPGTG